MCKIFYIIVIISFLGACFESNVRVKFPPEDQKEKTQETLGPSEDKIDEQPGDELSGEDNLLSISKTPTQTDENTVSTIELEFSKTPQNITPEDVVLEGDTAGCTVSVRDGDTLDPKIDITGCSTYGSITVKIVQIDESGNTKVIASSDEPIYILNTMLSDIPDFSVDEKTIFKVPISITKELSVPVAVNYQLTSLSAEAGQDFIDSSGTVIIPAGSKETSIVIHPISDAIKEGNESFKITTSIDKIPSQVEAVTTLEDDAPDPILTGVVDLIYGSEQICAKLDTGKLKCWGSWRRSSSGSFELFGSTISLADSNHGRFDKAYYPVEIDSLGTDVKNMSVKGWSAFCFMRTTDDVFCNSRSSSSYLVPGSPNLVDTDVQLTSLTSTYSKIDMVGDTACILDSSAENLLCWGANFVGQLGVGNETPSETPTPVSGISSVTDFAMAGSTVCAIHNGTSGDVSCWGHGSWGKLGNGGTDNSNVPVSTGISGATKIAAGLTHFCALLSDTTVTCWGENASGQIGNGTTSDALSPVSVPGLSDVAEISLGRVDDSRKGYSCVIKSNGSVWCWGTNAYGTLGTGEASGNIFEPVESTIHTKKVIKLANMDRTACALYEDQTMNCWGAYVDGLRGSGAKKPVSSDPLDVAFPSGVKIVKLEANNNTTCALTDKDAIYCWGFTKHLIEEEVVPTIDSHSIFRETPTLIGGFSVKPIKELSLSGSFLCVLFDDNSSECLGHDRYGNLGNETVGADNLSPASLSIVPSGILALSQGSMKGTYRGWEPNCAVLLDESIWCWGYNALGNLGDGTTATPNPPLAVQVTGLSGGAVDVAVAETFACGLLKDGAVYCWGENVEGNLGNGSTATNSPTPTPVTDLSNAKILYAVSNDDSVFRNIYGCAVLEDKTVKCWGYGENNLLLQSPPSDQSLTAVQLGGLSDVEELALLPRTMCARFTGGTVSCWGDNRKYEAAQETVDWVSEPTMVSQLSDQVDQVVSGASHVCALIKNGTVKCWGNHRFGQLGDKMEKTDINVVTSD